MKAPQSLRVGSHAYGYIVAAAAAGAWAAWALLWPALCTKRKPVRVLITGAAGQIGYALAPLIARGAMFGPNQPVILHLLDIEPASGLLEGVRLELIDCALPLLHDIIVTTDVASACQDVDFAIMLGGVVRKPTMTRRDVMARNVAIYKEQGEALAAHASPGVKIVVVASPANTNALVLRQHAPSIPAHQISALTRLDHNRALAHLAELLHVPVSHVRNVIIWGNHASSQFPDASHGTVDSKPLREAVGDDDYLANEFITTVQRRGAHIMQLRGLSTALSAANAICDHVRSWVHGTAWGEWVSMGVVSDEGAYGISPGLVYSYPVRCKHGQWSIVQGLQVDTSSWALMKASEDELLEERELALQCLQHGVAA